MLIHHGPTLSGKQSAPSPKRERDGKTLALSYIIEAMWNFRVSYCPTLQHKQHTMRGSMIPQCQMTPHPKRTLHNFIISNYSL